jgi:hypothetical protein
MTQTLRWYAKPQNGRQVLDIPWDAVNRRSVVVVTVAEWDRTPPVILGPDQARWVGDANVWVAGIAPRDGVFGSR